MADKKKKKHLPEEEDLPKSTKQRRIFKRTRAGEVLSREEVKEIKAKRKEIRRELRRQGLKKRSDFELTATSLGYYFDKHKHGVLLAWFLHGRLLKILLGAAAAGLAVLFAVSRISQMRGFFTINMTSDLFEEGFTLSESADFNFRTSVLDSDPVEDAPCTTLVFLPSGLDDKDGNHSAKDYFAYTFYIRNEGKSTVGYDWDLVINSESLELSKAAWVMVFEDGEMTFFAKAKADGSPDVIPASMENGAFTTAPYMDVAKYPEKQYERITSESGRTYYRFVPVAFAGDKVVTTGRQMGVAPLEVHKYTIVLWLEGNDPDCTNELIGGHVGLGMNFRLVTDDVK